MNKNNSQNWKEYFQRSAEYYSDPRFKMGYQIAGRPVPMEVIHTTINDVYDKMKLSSESILLDVGGGVGFFSKIFNQKIKSVVTTDISFNMMKSGHFSEGSCLVCESSFLPFRESSFNRLLCYSVFHYLENLDHVKKTILEF